MSADKDGIGFRLFTDSTVLHIRPDSTVEIFAAGTSTPVVWTGTTDENGVYSVPTLDTGHYDLRVDGVLVSSFHHVKADHSHSATETFQFFISGGITAGQDEVDTLPIFAPGVAGDIEKIEVTARSDATGDVVVHLLRGAVDGASALTVASNSVWQKQINPGSAKFRWSHVDPNPGVTISATQAIVLGIAWTANSVSGLCVQITFRPTV